MFKKAMLQQAKLRLALFGPAGSGKTYTALKIATGMAKELKVDKIGVIDSERGSAVKYADQFDFYVYELEDKTIDGYIKAIKEAEQSGFEILIIDSISHAWQELLDYVDVMSTKYKGNTLMAWRSASPLYKSFLNTILNYNGHIIVTMRSRTEWLVEKDESGKTKTAKIGLSPEQRPGIEYEFDLLGEINLEHTLIITKDRSGRFQDAVIPKPDIDFGLEIARWLTRSPAKEKEVVSIDTQTNQNTPPVPIEEVGEPTNFTEREFDELLISIYGDERFKEQKKKILNFFLVENFSDLNETQKLFIKEKLIEKLK
jgi:adenylate kinase family enzyme